MIRLPKYFSSSKERAHEEPGYGRDRAPTSLRARTQNTSNDSLEPGITEDPEKQKARHRLLGAGLLVLLAIVGLPKVFDSQPKKVSNDVVLQMVASVVDSSKDRNHKNDAKAVEEKLIEKKEDFVKKEGVESTKDVTPTKLEDVKDSKSSKLAEKEKALSQGEEVVEDISKAKKTTATKYSVNIGSFPTADRAKKWGVKLKEQKIPYFTQEKKKDDETVYMLRAGPFIDKSEAEVAEKKIKSMGLNPKIVESK
jgi:DedD protein